MLPTVLCYHLKDAELWPEGCFSVKTTPLLPDPDGCAQQRTGGCRTGHASPELLVSGVVILLDSPILSYVYGIYLIDIFPLANSNGVVWQLFDVQSGELELSVFSLSKGQDFVEFGQCLFKYFVSSPNTIIDMSAKDPIQFLWILRVSQHEEASIQRMCTKA